MNKRGVSKEFLIKLAILVIAILIISIITLKVIKKDKTGAEDIEKRPISNAIKSAFKFVADATNFVSKKLFGVTLKEGINKLLGIYSTWTSIKNFVNKFMVGLIAGCLVYLGNFIPKIFGWIEVFKEYKKRLGTKRALWFNFLAGNRGKILIIAIIYATLMQIGLLNRFIETITFYHLTPFWLRPVVLAIIIGYFPAIIEFLIKRRIQQRAERKVIQVKAGIESMKAAGGR